MTIRTRKVAKTVLILNRYFDKRTQSVICHVRNGENREYIVTLNQNGTSGCVQTNGEDCPSRRGGHKCYHITACSQAEQTRQEAQKAIAEVEFLLAKNGSEEVDEEYEQWKRDHGLDQPMSREEYTSFFTPCEY